MVKITTMISKQNRHARYGNDTTEERSKVSSNMIALKHFEKILWRDMKHE